MVRLWIVAVGVATFVATAPARAQGGNIDISSNDRTNLGLTIYRDFGVVSDVRRVVLPKGVVDVDYVGIPKTIEPSSVRVVSIGRESLFTLEQQTYQYDLLDKASLLKRYIGRKIAYSRDMRAGKPVRREGTLLAVNPEIVKFGDQVEIAPRGVISLPSIPEDLHTGPTLVWRIDNRYKGSQAIQTSYIAGDLVWSAVYRLDLNHDETAGDLSLWASVGNQSGMDYHNAKIELVAGDVKRVDLMREPSNGAAFAVTTSRVESVRSKPFFDYHVYNLKGNVDLNNKETRQFPLVAVRNLPVHKAYVLMTRVPVYSLHSPLKEWFDIHLSFENLSKYGLGIPLPQGRLRAFETDNPHELQLLGEDRVGHASRGETVTATVGKAFDLTAEHTQTGFRRFGPQGTEVDYRVDVHNHKNGKVTVTLDETFAGAWTITDQTVPGKRVDSSTQRYILTLGPGETRSFNYTVKING